MFYRNTIAATVAGALLLGSASLALAEDATSTSSTTSTSTSSTTATTTSATSGTATSSATTTTPAPTVDKRDYKLEIGPKGRVLLRGNLESVSGSVLKVRSWGGVWTVNVPTGAEVIPKVLGTNADITKFAAGDYIGIQGTIATNADFTIDAKIVRDWTSRKDLEKRAKEIEKEIRDKIKKEKEDIEDKLKEAKKKAEEALRNIARIWEGTAGDASGSSFAFTSDGKSFTVNTASTTKIVNRNWLPITLGDIRSGDAIRIYGALASSTITAEVVRDTSIPRASTSTPGTSGKHNGNDRDDD